MRSVIDGMNRVRLSALMATGLACCWCVGATAGEPSSTAAQQTQPVVPQPVAPSIVGLGLGASADESQPVRSRQRSAVPNIADTSERTPPPATPPVPMEPDAPRAPTPVPDPAIVNRPPLPPRAPLAPPFANRSAFHSRLWARRLSRVQQMRQDAEQSGDSAGAQRAEYLEGMVNELHRKGLFNFAQKVIGAMQERKLNDSAADQPSGVTELPEADLGEPAPLPDTDLGSPAPLPEE